MALVSYQTITLSEGRHDAPEDGAEFARRDDVHELVCFVADQSVGRGNGFVLLPVARLGQRRRGDHGR